MYYRSSKKEKNFPDQYAVQNSGTDQMEILGNTDYANSYYLLSTYQLLDMMLNAFI